MVNRTDDFQKKVCQLYEAQHRGERQLALKLLKELSAGFVACSDSPFNHFLEELLELYPEAIVICVERDKEKWWKSMEPVANNALSWFLPMLVWPVPGRRWFPKAADLFTERYLL